MRKIAFFIALAGVLLITVAGMLAFDGYMTEDRKDAVLDEINTQIDSGASTYEARREDGCRRRCGFFATMAGAIGDLRDGVFLSMPFDPAVVMPPSPVGWTQQAYTRATAEAIVAATYRETMLVVDTENSLLKDVHDIAEARGIGHVQVYQQGEKLILIGLAISKNALRAAKDGEISVATPVAEPFATLDGLPVRTYPQESVDAMSGNRTPVDYRYLTMNIDAQVAIMILARAEEEDLRNLLGGWSLAPIVEDLPHVPANYVAGAGLIVPEAVVAEEAGEDSDSQTD